MIPNKVYYFLAAGCILYLLYSEYMSVHKELTEEKGKTSLLKEATDILAADSKRKSEINIKRGKERDIARIKNKELQDDLKALKTTPQQAKCDITPTPDGYADRMLRDSD